jgi:hypothetical protein
MTAEDKILEILNTSTTTDIDWLVSFNGEEVRLIDPMDYHKIIKDILELFSQQCQKRDELIKAQDEYKEYLIRLLEAEYYTDFEKTNFDSFDYQSKIEQLKNELK